MRREISPEDMFKPADDEHITLKDHSTFDATLNGNLYIPSYVHSYSLAIEYMKKWFMNKFDSNFFKYVHVNGKHMFDDYKRFNKQNVKREKPLLIITPAVEFDHDRENLDLYTGGVDMWIRRDGINRSFFQDKQDNLYMAVNMKELKMNFNFRVKVSTRAQQLDIMEKMNITFRLGSTITEFKSADFVIPKEILLNIAKTKGFRIIDEEIVDPIRFINYLNSHSGLPFTYKLRNINNKPEYFIRINNTWCNIWLTNKLSVDDGEREGVLDNNFNIDMECSLRISVPQFFVFYTGKELEYKLKKDIGGIGFYSLSQFDIEPINEFGWDTVMNTEYQLDAHETAINMSGLFEGTDLERVIKSSLNKGISPLSFIEIRVHRFIAGDYPIVNSTMDFNESILYIDDLDKEQFIYLVMYIDKLYMNEELMTLDKMDGRID